jgi:hypothetical protein
VTFGTFGDLVDFSAVTGDVHGADWSEPVTGDELDALALAADPHAPIPADAVPYDRVIGSGVSLLPDWYMGHATAVHASKWRRPVILAVVAAFLLIDAAGLCSTYGIISWA